LILSIVLSGCSLVGEVNQSLEYANEATAYLTELSQFAEEAPQLIQDAATDSQAREELENSLNTLKQDIEEFNNTEAPAIAQDIHEQLVSKNEQLLAEIEKATENGELLIDQLENSTIFNTINEINELINQLEQLGG
jgi:hypothetical protein